MTLNSELRILGALVGARCVDASTIEHSVANHCDVATELQQQQFDLMEAKQEVARLERESKKSNGGPVPSQASTEAARSRVHGLQEEVKRLQSKVKSHENIGLLSRLPASTVSLEARAAAATSAASPERASPSQAPEPPISQRCPFKLTPPEESPSGGRWSTLKKGACLDLDSSDEEDIPPRESSATLGPSDADLAAEEAAWAAADAELSGGSAKASAPWVPSSSSLTPAPPASGTVPSSSSRASSSAHESTDRTLLRRGRREPKKPVSMSAKEYLTSLRVGASSAPPQKRSKTAMPYTTSEALARRQQEREREKRRQQEREEDRRREAEEDKRAQTEKRTAALRAPKPPAPKADPEKKKPEKQAKEVGKEEADAAVAAIRPGCSARIAGLVGDQWLNGKKVVVEWYIKETERWRVTVEDGCSKNVKAANLVPSEPSDDGSDDAEDLDDDEADEEEVVDDDILETSIVPVEKRSAGDASSSTRSSFNINVNQLAPKQAKSFSEFRHGVSASELKAMRRQGEVISAHVNLVKTNQDKNRFVKRKSPDDTQKTKKARRDDMNEESFARRQSLYASGASKSAALKRKMAVDNAGEPVKAEDGTLIKPEGENDIDKVGGSVQDDVQIAEGLRAPRWLWEALYHYQQHCVKWLWNIHSQRTGALVADEMGLGKTVQIAAYLGALHHSGILQKMRVQNPSMGTASRSSTGGVLIVAPATLLAQWKAHIHDWYPPLRVCILHSLDEKERKESMEIASSKNGVLITTYETLRNELDDLLAFHWVIVVLDEGQRIRNPHARITMAAKRFSTPHRIILSGSPIQNRLEEMWSLFDFIAPGRLGTLPVFAEEFAFPIENGNLMGANQTRVATAYQCAKLLRELTMPHILRRTKAEVIDTLKLPPKQEQVLFCNLTPEQYQVYIDFLNTDMVMRARMASTDKKGSGAVFFSLSVLRKLCNHPDLLLKDAGPEMLPTDMWNHERSGKMKVLAEVLKVWHSENHRALIFAQTVQMLNILQHFMDGAGYSYLRIDGQTAIGKRAKLVNEFNSNATFFTMLLTTRVGGVGLNICGADRVLIFDPDWNPMTDVQARERIWRIGQKREVAIYRLVLTSTLEEKIYQRQVYKHFISQKVMNDPRQRQFFKWNDLADLFAVPDVPPNFDARAMREMKQKYKAVLAKNTHEQNDEFENETTEVMKSIAELPVAAANTAGAQLTEEHNTIVQTLYDTSGIKATFNHDKVEQPLLDRKILRDGVNAIAERALRALQSSARECSNVPLGTPTWTGQTGQGGAPLTKEPKAKREHGSSSSGHAASSNVSSTVILGGLKQLAKMRATARGTTPGEEASSLLAKKSKPLAPDKNKATAPIAVEDELHESDKKIAEMILKTFLDPKIAGWEHNLSTGAVLEKLGTQIAPHHGDLFKTLLKQMCNLSKSPAPGQPGTWTLRKEFWPANLPKPKEEVKKKA
eukprot:TRINITY_DN12425_c0_g1_i3.p1 TRINITY_DN12425_c0_g1~~TRINITY_DN12425_c0_g1_i3.p1  ORF type:complete len:1451 (-),score=306.87 TRINITY_DN12425_c0_g1_i3:349-4701(-)